MARTIVGIRNTSFTPKDSDKTIEGLTFHTVEPFPDGQGKGNRTDKFFLSAAKVKALAFTPSVGQNINLLYNNWGKPEVVQLVDDIID